MRIRARAARILVLLALPGFVAALGLSVLTALLLVLAVLLWAWIGTLRGLRPRAGLPSLRLETIGASHFVEKVRWSLDLLGVEYVEEHNLGVLGVVFTGRTVPRLIVRTGLVDSTLGNSPEILRYLWGRYGNELGNRAEFLTPTPQAVELEARLDRYGVLLQQWIYVHILDHRELVLHAWGVHDPRVPAWQRTLARPLFPLLRVFIRRAFRLGPGRREKTMTRLQEVLDPLEATMSDGRRDLLGTDSLSYVDITLAALSGLWLLPPNYGGEAARYVRLRRADAPAEMIEDIETLRARCPRLVDHMERLYAAQRTPGR